jgi:hypothetical protein
MHQHFNPKNVERACNFMILSGFAALWGFVYKHSLTIKPDDTLTPYGHYSLGADKLLQKTNARDKD